MTAQSIHAAASNSSPESNLTRGKKQNKKKHPRVCVFVRQCHHLRLRGDDVPLSQAPAAIRAVGRESTFVCVFVCVRERHGISVQSSQAEATHTHVYKIKKNNSILLARCCSIEKNPHVPRSFSSIYLSGITWGAGATGDSQGYHGNACQHGGHLRQF